MPPPYQAPGVYVEEVPSAIKPIAGVGTSIAAFIGVSADIVGPWDPAAGSGMPVKANGDAYLQAGVQVARPINSWTEFTQSFGDLQTANQYLAHAVYGFFNNGGGRCWVIRVAALRDLAKGVPAALDRLEGQDEVAIVAAPLPPETPANVLNDVHTRLVGHCEKLGDRVAVLDSTRDVKSDNLVISADDSGIWRPGVSQSGYGAFYFPWIQVSDPLSDPGARIAVPPSGHVAGIYARSDATRGVHKAPANEVVRGALGVQYPVSRPLLDVLSPRGVNVIRTFDGTIKVYGARTLASDPQGDPEWAYVNVRRFVNYLKESLDEGMQWAVFEPNAPELWSKVRRNVGAFLNGLWATGALVGTTAQQAYYVRCDETTNPPDIRNAGQLVTEIGVAIVRPAEFVVFRLSQWAGPAR
jgi:phage tail sheath protein FI